MNSVIIVCSKTRRLLGQQKSKPHVALEKRVSKVVLRVEVDGGLFSQKLRSSNPSDNSKCLFVFELTNG